MKIRVDGPDLKLVVAWTEHLTYPLFSLLGREPDQNIFC